jgi:hypothetical protein
MRACPTGIWQGAWGGWEIFGYDRHCRLSAVGNWPGGLHLQGELGNLLHAGPTSSRIPGPSHCRQAK